MMGGQGVARTGKVEEVQQVESRAGEKAARALRAKSYLKVLGEEADKPQGDFPPPCVFG